MFVITGDTHRDFHRLLDISDTFSINDTAIILGDAGINYYMNFKDDSLKQILSDELNCTLFIIHGNHEKNPEYMDMNEKIWNDGIVYYESNYPKILYAKDGEIYNFDGKKVLVLGGAYSVDKYYRLAHGWQWFDDEQMSSEVKDRCIENIKANNWTVDIVLSHTVPYNYRPIDLFLSCIDQSTVDESMENWLQYIEDNLTYQKWYAGHYHCDRVVNKIELMFTTIKELII